MVPCRCRVSGPASPGAVSLEHLHALITASRALQLGMMLTSMLLSQKLDFHGDVDEFALQLCKERAMVSTAVAQPPSCRRK